MKRPTLRLLSRGLAGLLALAIMPLAMAGPPLLCHPFDTAGAPSLGWGGAGWHEAQSDYDLARLATRTEALLDARTPVIARMETLRRAALYASGDGRVARDLLDHLQARIGRAVSPDTGALARFDVGYFAETLQAILRLKAGGGAIPGLAAIDVAGLRSALSGIDADALLEAALARRPDDAAMHFAVALVEASHDRDTAYARQAALARAGARGDPLLLRNLAQIAQ